MYSCRLVYLLTCSETAGRTTLARIAINGVRSVAHGFFRTVRRCRSRSRSRRLRSCHGRCPHGPAHRPVHPQCRSHRADELQSCRRRHRQGTPRSRDRCPRRHHGRGHRRRRHPVPPAQHLPRPRRLVAPRPVRQAALPPENARSSRVPAQPPDQASRGRRAPDWTR